MDDILATVSAMIVITLSSVYWHSKLNRLKKTEEEELLLWGKKKAYDILLKTMSDYWTQHPDGNFEEFMKIMWPSDYKILKNADIKRDYTEWNYLLFMMKPLNS